MRPVISPAELADLLASSDPPVVVDVRWSLTGPPGREDFAAGRLPGAVYLDMESELAAAPGPGGRHPLPDPATLQAGLRRAGIGSDRAVVAYDAANGSVAARLWWLLRWAGHPRVAVLDGGMAAWRAAGLPLSTAETVPQTGTITVRPGAMPVLDAADAAALARDGVLLDARAAPRYRGENEPVDPRAGHVPGARSAPFSALTDGEGRWHAPEALRDLAAHWGVGEPGGPVSVGAYCGSGINACALVLGLELAGVTSPERPAALYAGSWSQWCTDPQRPVATGEEPG
ncbi:MAG TPA: sulfurtransferase [Pseudonocardiaceae bacterium]